ncbi:MAG: Insulinase-like:Peptidase C-terminal [Acidobacteriales bacterium]|nr:Insulinase-like:Peptidase C-terminal [Terriglobales bacterium]
MKATILKTIIASLLLGSLVQAQTAKPKPAAAPAASAQAGGLKLPTYKKVTLKNGLTVLLMEQHRLPIVSMSYIVRAGSTADPKGKEGLASLTAGLLRKGTKTRSSDQISNDLDYIGMTFGASANPDYTGGSAEFIKKDTARALDLFTDVLLNPVFPADELAKLQKQRIDGIKSAKDSVQGVMAAYYDSYLFKGHPYGRPAGGDEKSLASINQGDVASFYAANYTPGNTILAVVGDFSSPEMERLLNEKFQTWNSKTTKAAPVPAAVAVTGKKLLLIDKPDSTQTYYYIGNVGIARNNPDRVYVNLVNTLFGGRFTSMLNTDLRIKSGLTYGASSRFTRRMAPGPFAITSFTKNATTEKALDMTLDVVKRLHEKGITEAELQSAKNYIKGQFPPTIETSDALAGQIADLEFYGLDASEINDLYAKIDAMNVATAQRIINQYFPADNLVFVVVGKASEIETAAKKYAPVMDKKSITDPGY